MKDAELLSVLYFQGQSEKMLPLVRKKRVLCTDFLLWLLVLWWLSHSERCWIYITRGISFSQTAHCLNRKKERKGGGGGRWWENHGRKPQSNFPRIATGQRQSSELGGVSANSQHPAQRSTSPYRSADVFVWWERTRRELQWQTALSPLHLENTTSPP